MKLIIDIPEMAYNAYKEWHKNKIATVEQSLIANGIPYEERPLNEAIKTIKAICKANDTCTYCPMNFNCGEYPDVWQI